jgi:drug/metabolite transporter (DMT)-like permease
MEEKASVHEDSRQPENRLAYGALAGAVVALTLSPLFIRWADAPGMITSFYRMVIAAVILTPFALHKIKTAEKPPVLEYLFPILAGVFSSLDHGLWATAIEQTTVANATLLNNISPLWVALFALLVWRERLGVRFWIGLAALLAGASLVLGSTILIRPDFVRGDFYAIASSLFYAGFYLTAQRGRKRIATLPFLWIMMVTAAVSLLVITQSTGLPLGGYSQTTYLVFISAALVSQLGGYFLLTYTLGNLPASVVTPTMAAQPVLTALLAIPLEGEALLAGQILGGAAVLGGIYLVNTARGI